MQVYDGRRDIVAPKTKHTVLAVSSNRIAQPPRDCMTIRKNGRADWSLFYCETGCLYFDDYRLTAGMLWIYPPRVPQRYTILSRDSAAYRYLHFTGSDVETLLSALHIPLEQPIRLASGYPLELLEKIRRTVSAGDAASAIRAEAYILLLLSVISGAPSKTEASAMKSVTDEMEHAFAEPYDVRKYAAMTGLSVGRFNHLFRQSVGMPPHAYYASLRMENACNLMENTELPIKDIANICGYTDALYFAQAFRKSTGTTPTDYRRISRSRQKSAEMQLPEAKE
jgi:AraC-like DNA-binding protein